MNNHFAAVGDKATELDYSHGIQLVDEEKIFNNHVNTYLRSSDVADSGFNYHVISVFGSQSTGKSTLLNQLFGTGFAVMSERQRQQTTKGIWMSKNKLLEAKMAENILVMDVEGTDGHERGDDKDFERKSALFAMATSEVLLVNLWENQVGLYHGANMGLLKIVFEVNLELFLNKDKQSTPRSLLLFVIRDHLGTTSLDNLRATLEQDLANIWSSIAKPPGFEQSRIEDYFDFAFSALPHKVLQPEQFAAEVAKLRLRFSNGARSDGDDKTALFLPEYHRRIPADGFHVYAEGIWDQIVHNKDLDLPTQQELLAQFRCDEILREVLGPFGEIVTPLEEKQAEAVAAGKPVPIDELGVTGRSAREQTLQAFQVQASRYHKGVYERKKLELEGKVDSRLKALYHGQLAALHKLGVLRFSQKVSERVKQGQKAGGNYEFADMVASEKVDALAAFRREAESLAMEGVAWTDFSGLVNVFSKEIDRQSAQLRKDEMRRLVTRLERWVQSRLNDAVGVEFNKLGSVKSAGTTADVGGERENKPEDAPTPPAATTTATERELWDRIWAIFTQVSRDAESRFVDRAKSFEADEEEVDVGLWRLRRKSWLTLRNKINEEVMESNILLKLRENFEDKFRYDEAGVPRIWRPTDDIEGIYTKARESTLHLIPILSRFRLAKTSLSPDLITFIGRAPAGAETTEEEDLVVIGGVDEDDGKSLEEEMTILNEGKRQDLVMRFKKMADGVYVEAKRSAIGGMTQVPFYFYVLLLVLGWNEIYMVLRNPMLFVLVLMLGGGAYVAYSLHLLGPMTQMANAAANQGVELSKQKLRDFLQNSDTARQALAMPARANTTDIDLDELDTRGRKVSSD